MTELKPCPKCAVQPKEETKVFKLGNYRDGGYNVLIGRYVCPVCGFGQTWEQSYSVYRDWSANINKWNDLVSKYESGGADNGNQ